MPSVCRDTNVPSDGFATPTFLTGTVRLLAFLLSAALLLSGCTAPPIRFDPYRGDVTSARNDARLAATAALAQLTQGHPTVASAVMDHCAAGLSGWKVAQSWAYECSLDYSVVLVVSDLEEATALVGTGLTSLRCDAPTKLADEVSRLGTLNPGEPQPGEPNFRPGVLPPFLNQCGDYQVWSRLSSSDDPLLEMVAADAASTTDPLVVSARPFQAGELSDLRASGAPVILFLTVSQLYHQEPR